ncbi:MAG: phosphotransferase [Proteobacteria bacterium]|nr:phosphotransferase [Pseudomonadota bacterium]
MTNLARGAPERGREIDHFLSAAGWSGAVCAPLAGDASARRYLRLRRGSESAVLMDSGATDIGPFCHVARHLRGLGYSAPGILAEDSAGRLLLLEDLGDLSFSRCLEDPSGPAAVMLYSAAVDLLVELGRAPVGAGIPAMDADYLAAEIRLFAEWWPPDGSAAPARAAQVDAWVAAWRDAHELALMPPQGLALRDFHAANLMWLPGREGLGRVGLLDFQDAVAAPLAYDLMSLLQDVRRDVPEDLQAAMIARFLAAFPELDVAAFRTAYAILGAHRNLRIAGIFSRLARRDGKRGYLDYLPRVWRYIAADLRHPALAPVAQWLAQHVPASQRGGG